MGISIDSPQYIATPGPPLPPLVAYIPPAGSFRQFKLILQKENYYSRVLMRVSAL